MIRIVETAENVFLRRVFGAGVGMREVGSDVGNVDSVRVIGLEKVRRRWWSIFRDSVRRVERVWKRYLRHYSI